MDNFLNNAVRRQVFTNRFLITLGRKYHAQLTTVLNAVASSLDSLPNSDMLEYRMSDINKIISNGFTNADDFLLDNMGELIANEYEFLSKQLELNTGIVANAMVADKLIESVYNVPMNSELIGSKKTLRQALDEFDKTKTTEIKRILSNGRLANLTYKEVTKQINDLNTGRLKNQAYSLVKTLGNHSTSVTDRAFTKNHSSQFTHEVYISVLDNHTTLTCAKFSNQIFKIGEGKYPPLHWGCRSRRLPVLRSEIDRNQTRIEAQNFDEWLKKQDNDFIDEYFSGFQNSEEKAKLFKSGKLDIQQYTDSAGREYTLDELKRLNNLTGLDI